MNRLLLFIGLTLTAFTGWAQQTAQPTFTLTQQTAEPDTGKIISSPVWQQVPLHKTFHAPWSDGKQDETTFQCYLSPHYFYFKFCVKDLTLTLQEPFREKTDVGHEDRAEIFLSATPDMKIYYCMEMDPRGRALDYVARHYRQYDYTWSFHTLQMETLIHNEGYIVAGRLSTLEMMQLGIPLNRFYMGVFRADFNTSHKVVWYSLLKSDLKKADFHRPEMLFCVNVK